MLRKGNDKRIVEKQSLSGPYSPNGKKDSFKPEGSKKIDRLTKQKPQQLCSWVPEKTTRQVNLRLSFRQKEERVI